MGFVRPLDAFPLIRTRNVDELRSSLGRIYAKPVMNPVGRGEAFHAVMNFCQLKHVGLHYAFYGAGVHFDFPATNFFAQLFPVKGAGAVEFGGASVAIDAGRSVALSADAAYRLTTDADYERLNLTIDPKALAEKLAAMVGEAIPAPLTLLPSADAARPLAQVLRQNFMFLVGQMSGAPRPPALLLAEFEQALMVMFLHTNRHNYSHLLEKAPSSVAVQQVRVAEEYIEANWDKPLCLEAVALEVGVGTIGLFQSFRQIRGYSPMEFLKHARLRHAWQMLQGPEASTTVSEVAFACGFVDFDRFRDDYCRAFGERPSETLDRGRGGRILH